ncbi:MAG TPA: hypothetical protein VNF06_01085 [Candidatus Aquilonibacter sp.]|nr:hypothetical protein [Candidatus Aquilonibacter sp.]
MSQYIPKLVESVRKGDPDSVELAKRITSLLRNEDPEAQWQAYDKIASAIVSKEVNWPSDYKIEAMVGNVLFFQKFGEEKVREISKSSGGVFFRGTAKNKELVMDYLTKEVGISQDYLLKNPSTLEVSIVSIKPRWEHYLQKSNKEKFQELSEAQRTKMFTLKDIDYVSFLNSLGLRGSLAEYLKFSGREKKVSEEKSPANISKLILGAKAAILNGNRAEAIHTAHEIDLRLLGYGNHNELRPQTRSSFVHEIFGISQPLNSSCRTMAENFFFFKDMGIADPLAAFQKTPSLLNFSFYSRWGTFNYLVLEMKIPLEKIWESPIKVAPIAERIIPRHQYYLKKGKPTVFGKSKAGPISYAALDYSTDQAYIDYFRKRRVQSTLEEYVEFKNSPEIKAIIEFYTKSAGPMEGVKRKISRLNQSKTEPKNAFYEDFGKDKRPE